MHPTGELTLERVLRHRAETDGGSSFIIWEAADGTWTESTYAEVDTEVDRLAARLVALGVRPGEPVIVHSANRPEMPVALLALNRLGAIAVPTIAQYMADELSYVIEHVGATGLIADPRRLDIGEEAARGKGLRFFMSMAQESPDPWLSWPGPDEWAEPSVPRDSSVEEPAIVMYSSGTTARPKGVVLSNRALTTSAETNAQHQRLRPDDRWMCIVPVFHVNGLLISTMATLVTGGSIVMTEQFVFERYMRQLRTYLATIAFVPAMVARRLLQQPPAPSDTVHHLRLMLFGMPLGQDEVDAFERRFGVPMANLWGMTENAGLGTRTPLYLPHRGAAIGLPMLGSEIRITGGDGHEVARGAPGVAHYRGAGLADGYLHDAVATQDAFFDGWMNTQDIMEADELGYLTFVDRDKDVIKVKAENVSSSEVERALSEHPAVAEAAAVGLPDERLGERIVAFIVPEAGQVPDADEIRQHAARLLAAFKVPREIHLVEELPKTSTLKIKKAALREIARTRQ